MGVIAPITDALDAVGIQEAFPIQEMTLSVALAGTDLIGQARTGTGKTLAFSIPVIQRIAANPDPEVRKRGKPQALIVAPTRELAIQVAGDVATASKNLDVRALTIYGGVPYEPQLEALEAGVDIVIGTPGRVLDLVNRGDLEIGYVNFLVLDEADEMLDLGFLPDVEALLARTPESRQTMLFSATMPAAIVTLARQHMRQAMNIRAESTEANQTVPSTQQFVWQAHEMDKPEVVARILQADEVGRVVVFTRTKRAAQRVADDLSERGFQSSPLHGDMAQKAREKALQGFRDGKVNILVATDVAARGIDVAGITHVINYTCPEDDKTYVHRIGRTGRAGASGVAVTFVDWADLQRWKLINKALDLPFDEPVETYSTSDHLFTDMKISRDVTGRIVPKSADSQGSKSGGSRSGSGSDNRSNRSGGQQRNRGGSGRSGSGESRSQQSNSGGQNSGGSSDSSDKPKRNRQRRRTRGGQPAGGQNAAASTSNSAPKAE